MNERTPMEVNAFVGAFSRRAELDELKRKRFPPEGKAERVAAALAALQDLPPMQLSPEQLRAIALDELED